VKKITIKIIEIKFDKKKKHEDKILKIKIISNKTNGNQMNED